MKTRIRYMLITTIILFILYTFDLITTVIGLSLGAYEMNPIAGAYFELGIAGIFIGYVYMLTVVCFLAIVLVNAIAPYIYYKMCGKYIKDSQLALLNVILIIAVIFLQVMTQIGNIWTIIQLL